LRWNLHGTVVDFNINPSYKWQRRGGICLRRVKQEERGHMTMDDRVAVLEDGVLRQCDAPGTL
jgi:ABC-type sugar transport system ATPase subunit